METIETPFHFILVSKGRPDRAAQFSIPEESSQADIAGDAGDDVLLAVFHDLNLAAQYCPRLVLLSQGRLLADGRPEEVLTGEQVSHVYGTQVAVMAHPCNGAPVVLPVRTETGTEESHHGQ